MEQPSYLLGRGELVVQLHGLGGLPDVRWHAAFGEPAQGARVDLKLQVHAAGQHDDPSAGSKEFLDVGGLDARTVPGAGLGPVPLPAAAGNSLKSLPWGRPSTSM